MACVEVEKIFKKNPSMYKMVLVVAERANQIAAGSKPLVVSSSKRATTIALQELQEGKVWFEEKKLVLIMTTKKKVLIGNTGSIAAYKVYDVIRTLQKQDIEVKCVVTKAGEKFISKVTLEAFLRSPIYGELFGDYSDKRAVHIPLAEWADVVAIIPATANIMAKVACGIADELLTSVILATKSKGIFVPAMHTNMWNNVATQDNVKKLQSYGYSFIGPEIGMLSDGTSGIGHIASHDMIFNGILRVLGK